MAHFFAEDHGSLLNHSFSYTASVHSSHSRCFIEEMKMKIETHCVVVIDFIYLFYFTKFVSNLLICGVKSQQIGILVYYVVVLAFVSSKWSVFDCLNTTPLLFLIDVIHLALWRGFDSSGLVHQYDLYYYCRHKNRNHSVATSLQSSDLANQYIVAWIGISINNTTH